MVKLFASPFSSQGYPIEIEEFKGIPSVLGIDFINAKGLDLRFNSSKGEAFLFGE